MKKTIPLTLFVNVVSITIAFGFYALAFRVSLAPFWIATAMLIIAVVGPCVIVLIDRGQSRLVSLGLANMIMVTAFYFFFGVVFFFFYLMFAPLPLYAHAVGLALGITLTGYWMAVTARDVDRALATSRFVQQAFED
ncbi:hypothetical protein [Paraburkholderia nodosa]|uniref:hypothetical protein n=1 Tax=Paraburkholderia nodosa TaxID=392320 RepID=UPI0008418679|nr:hypothetical protein [Paraburkholderia nodosa]